MKIETVRELLNAEVVFVRSKKPTEEMIKLAKSTGIVMMLTDYRMYDACGMLYANGLIGKKVRHE